MEAKRYKIESRPIIDLARDIRSGRLILSPYFQRELVWRETHKRDFIDTILQGFPFPLIFVSRGRIDVERMQATSMLVDGQQRLSTIVEYLGDKFDVDGKKFSDLSIEHKEDFLKYEVPVIDLDFPEDDPRIKEAFRRLNRTLYSLTEIERLAMEYSSSDFMLTAKLMAKQLVRRSNVADLSKLGTDDSDEFEDLGYGQNMPQTDPDIPDEFWSLVAKISLDQTHKLLLTSGVFSPYEISRQVHLMFALNLLATAIEGGFYSRNERIREYLENYAPGVPNRDDIVGDLEVCCGVINRASFGVRSYWRTKANTFSLVICLYRHIDATPRLSPPTLKNRLDAFAKVLPANYGLAAKEAVNRRRERSLRHAYLERVIFSDEPVDEIRIDSAT
jgi:hypothetical protein